jgi:hypothetical protein
LFQYVIIEPIFDGMPKLYFEDMSQGRATTPSKMWGFITKQLLNFYAPKDGALVLKAE